MSLDTSQPTTHTTTGGVPTLLGTPRFELMPFDSFDEQLEQLPDGAAVAVTTSPQLGLDATVEKTEQGAALGYEMVPHIAARYVRDRDHLAEIARRLTEAGVNDVFVPGGDREEPAGEFDSALGVLAALEDLPYEFEEVGITGYPEGHDFLTDRTLEEAMAEKEPYATYIVTQLCYDAEAVIEWIERIRAQGISLPVEVGIPGVMNYARLIDISRKVGVGDSIRFLRKTTGITGFLRRFVGSRGVYTPDTLVEGLAPYAADPEYDIRGVHIYTFNRTTDTESWRFEIIAEQS